MAIKCIVIGPDLITEIVATVEYTVLEDLTLSIAAVDGTIIADLKTAIRADIPSIDLNVDVSIGYLPDAEGPVVIPETFPLPGVGGVSINGPMFIVVDDSVSGVDLTTLKLTVNTVEYTQDSSEVDCLPIDPPYRYAIRFIPSTIWALNSTISVSLEVDDKAGNPGIIEARI
jgi:hypothetical protein